MNEAEFFVVLASIIACTTLGVTFLRVLGRYLERKAGGGGPDVRELAERVERLERDVPLLRDADVRLGDLEERLEFAERLLARAQARELPGERR